jgi:hypothetical protein
LVGAKRFALPFARLAILAHDTGARHGDLGLAERARERALAMAMPAAKPLGPKGRSGLGFLCRATRGGLFIGFRQSNRRGNAILDKAAQHPAQGALSGGFVSGLGAAGTLRAKTASAAFIAASVAIVAISMIYPSSQYGQYSAGA